MYPPIARDGAFGLKVLSTLEEQTLIDETTYGVGVFIGAYHEYSVLLGHYVTIKTCNYGFVAMRKANHAVLCAL